MEPASWFARLTGRFRRKKSRSGKPPQLRPNLELLERRELLSLNVWLPQRLEVNSGISGGYFGYRLFQPVAAELQPLFDSQSGTSDVTGSFALTTGGDYSLTLNQAGTVGGDSYAFWESGTVAFSLSVAGQLTPTGFSPTSASATQTATLDWTYLELDGSDETVQSLGGTETVVVTDGAVADPFFWAGLNWRGLTQQLSDDNGLGLSSLSADSFTVDEAGDENYALTLSDGLATLTASGSEPVADLEETGSEAYASTTVRAFSGTQQGQDSFTLHEDGSYSGDFVFGSVAYGETGSGSASLDETGTYTATGTMTASGLQSFGPPQNQVHESQGEALTFKIKSDTFTYHEDSSGPFTLTEQGGYAGGSFSLGSLTYAGQGSGNQSLSLFYGEGDSGSFSATESLAGVNSFGIDGTLTDGTVDGESGTFTESLSGHRSESAAGTYDRSILGSYAGQRYDLSNFSLGLSASGTFSTDQSVTETESATGSATENGTGTDSFTQAFGSTSSQDGVNTESYGTTSTYTGTGTSSESLNESGELNYTLTQIGSASGGGKGGTSVSLSSFVFSTSESGSSAQTVTGQDTQSGTATDSDHGTGTGSDTTTYATTGDSGQGAFDFTDTGSYSYTDNESLTAIFSGTFSRADYRAGQFSGGSWNLSSVAIDRAATSFGTTTSIETQAESGTETMTETDSGSDAGGMSFAGVDYSNSDGSSLTDTTTGPASETSTDNSTMPAPPASAPGRRASTRASVTTSPASPAWAPRPPRIPSSRPTPRPPPRAAPRGSLSRNSAARPCSPAATRSRGTSAPSRNPARPVSPPRAPRVRARPSTPRAP